MEILGYIASVIMGLSLGLIGGGGSILTVPILVYLFGIDPVTASGYSLFIVGLSSMVGGVTYLRQGSVDLKTGTIFAIPSFIGVFLSRAWLVPSLPDPVFHVGNFAVTKAVLIMLVFAILMILASYSMIRTKSDKQIRAETIQSSIKRYFFISVEGLIVGGITGFVGAGGGFLIIPALVMLVGLPMKIAVGTSLFIIAIKSLFGFLGDIQSGASIDWFFLFVISAIAIIGIFVGSAISRKVNEKRLKQGFGWFVLIMGSFILVQQLLQI